MDAGGGRSGPPKYSTNLGSAVTGEALPSFELTLELTPGQAISSVSVWPGRLNPVEHHHDAQRFEADLGLGYKQDAAVGQAFLSELAMEGPEVPGVLGDNQAVQLRCEHELGAIIKAASSFELGACDVVAAFAQWGHHGGVNALVQIDGRSRHQSSALTAASFSSM